MQIIVPTLIAFAFLSGCTSLSGSTAGDDTMSMAGTSSGMQGMTDMPGMAPGMVHVKVRDGAFDPTVVNATMDGGIHFTNEGSQRHTVSIVDGTGTLVLDAQLEPGQAVHFQPEAPGAYHAFCRLHSGMTADLQIS